MSEVTSKIKTKGYTECESVNKSAVSLECLPEECLLLIFQNLYIRDRIVIERVCKKWRYISLKSWSNIKELYLGYFFDEFYEMDWENFRHVFWRCGNHLTALYFRNHSDNFVAPDDLFAMINDYCKKLEILQVEWCFDDYDGLDVDLKQISNVAQNLKTLQISERASIINIPYFLKKATNLEVVSLYSLQSYTVYALRDLSDRCKELNLKTCKLQNKNRAIQLFQKLLNLKKLDVSSTKITPETLIPASKRLVSLKLKHNATAFFKDGNLKKLIMPNLKYLSVKENPAITDETLALFYKCFPSLETLILNGCYNLKFDPSCRLGKCESIKNLDISSTDITDEGLKYLSTHLTNLKALNCNFCLFLTKRGYTACFPTKMKHFNNKKFF